MKKVQEIVREAFPNSWIAGQAYCTNDIQRHLNGTKRFYRFTYMRLSKDDVYEENTLIRMLEREGYKIDFVSVHPELKEIRVRVMMENFK